MYLQLENDANVIFARAERIPNVGSLSVFNFCYLKDVKFSKFISGGPLGGTFLLFISRK